MMTTLANRYRKSNTFFLLATITLVGCASQRSSGTNHVSLAASMPGSATNSASQELVYEMNPLPMLAAQGIKYPPGHDTIAYWGNGRFSIISDGFYDAEAAGSLPSFHHVRAFRYEMPIIYCMGKDGFLVVDLRNSELKTFPQKDQIPEQYRAAFKKLEDERQMGNFRVEKR